MENIEKFPKTIYEPSSFVENSFLEEDKSRVYVPFDNKTLGHGGDDAFLLGRLVEKKYSYVKFTGEYGEDEKGIFFKYKKSQD